MSLPGLPVYRSRWAQITGPAISSTGRNQRRPMARQVRAAMRQEPGGGAVSEGGAGIAADGSTVSILVVGASAR